MATRMKKAGLSDKVPIDMTPMIDIVFQLLTFFIMTLKIVAQEGDFNIKMPLSAPRQGQPEEQIPPIKIRLVAGVDGSCQDIIMNDRSFGADGWKALHEQIAGLV